MSKFKRLTAILLSAVMFVCTLSIPAGADSIEDTAKNISSGKTYNIQLYNDNITTDYKINATQSGTLSIKITSQMSYLGVTVYDSNGNKVQYSNAESKSGGIDDWPSFYCCWNRTIEKYAGTLTYRIKKGTSYISFFYGNPGGQGEGSGKLSFTATFPTSSSSSAKLTGIIVPMKVWDTLQLSAAASSKTSGTVKWSSSNTSVATVSSTGKVTAKKKGTAVITAKLGDSSAKIVIKVT